MSNIKNIKELNISKTRKKALQIVEAGLKAVDPKILLKSSIKYNKDFNSIEIQNNIYDILSGRIFVIGGGKAVGNLAEALEEILGKENIIDGQVNSIKDRYKNKIIKINVAGHPLPDKNGILGVKAMLDLKKKHKINKRDLVICLLSGGASSMLVYPSVNLSLEDKQATTQILIKSGANINEINIIRKHLSQIKGGQLARFFEPAQVAAIIISDVAGNNPSVIGSGPTAADSSTFQDALNVVIKYKLEKKIPKKVLFNLQMGIQGQIPDTPKELNNTKNYIIGKNSNALEAMAFKAKNLGLKPLIVTPKITGTAFEAASVILNDFKQEEYKKYNCFLYGGETTLALPENHGKGGRNQFLASLMPMVFEEENFDWVFVSVSSDGRDYIKGVAGAITDSKTINVFKTQKKPYKDYLREFDTYSLLKKTKNSLIKINDTGTNVGDLILLIKKQSFS